MKNTQPHVPCSKVLHRRTLTITLVIYSSIVAEHLPIPVMHCIYRKQNIANWFQWFRFMFGSSSVRWLCTRLAAADLRYYGGMTDLYSPLSWWNELEHGTVIGSKAVNHTCYRALSHTTEMTKNNTTCRRRAVLSPTLAMILMYTREW